MSFSKYYEDELSFLYELGREFAQENPKLAPFLSEKGNDPDVERLLEGFAFLSGRLREKLDDEFPELTHSLMRLLWPHYLRPVPSMSILEFQPIPTSVTERQVVKRGVELDTGPVADVGVNCHFRTCYDVQILPLTIDKVEYRRAGDGGLMDVGFELFPGVSIDKTGLTSIRLYLHSEPGSHVAAALYLWLFRYLKDIQVTVEVGGGGKKVLAAAPISVEPVGFGDDEALLPYPPSSFSGYRLLQEYFSLPEKFLFVDLKGFECLHRYARAQRFDVSFRFTRPLPDQVRIRAEHVRLFCTPIVNLFRQDGEPLRLEHRQTEYRVRAGGGDPRYHEVFSVDSVEGWVQGSGSKRRYAAFESFDHEIVDNDRESCFYRLRLRPPVVGRGVETYLSFVSHEGDLKFPPAETVSLGLTCSNRSLPAMLRIGDISVDTDTSPEFARFKNISRVSPSLAPPLGVGLHWRLISNMALNYLSLLNVDVLREILASYDFRAFVDAQAERTSKLRLQGIEQLQVKQVDRLREGLPVRGLRTVIKLTESKFGGQGLAGESGMFLFASVLNEFFSLYASVNSFHELQVQGLERGEVYRWPARIGYLPLL